MSRKNEKGYLIRCSQEFLEFFLQAEKLNWDKSEREESNRYSRSPFKYRNGKWGQEDA